MSTGDCLEDPGIDGRMILTSTLAVSVLGRGVHFDSPNGDKLRTHVLTKTNLQVILVEQPLAYRRLFRKKKIFVLSASLVQVASGTTRILDSRHLMKITKYFTEIFTSEITNHRCDIQFTADAVKC
jgi:hypothetical protein